MLPNEEIIWKLNTCFCLQIYMAEETFREGTAADEL